MRPAPKPGAARPRKKTCKNPGCKKRYQPHPRARLHENWCSHDCAIAILRIKQQREREKQQREFDRETKRRKKALKSDTQLWREELKRAEKAVCWYVRVRDKERPCISCGRSVAEVEAGPFKPGGYWDGGHYLPKSTHPELRFNTDNVHKQCKTCNGGEFYVRNSAKMAEVKAGYDAGILAKIGPERLRRLTAPHPPLQPDIEYLERVKRIFNRRARHLERIRGYR